MAITIALNVAILKAKKRKIFIRKLFNHEESMKVYIAGKISGLDYMKARRTFEVAEASLKARGYEVINPIKLCGEGWPWTLCMVVCLLALMRCRCVCLLPGWETSRGAKIEKRVAEFLGRGVYTYIPEQNNSGE